MKQGRSVKVRTLSLQSILIIPFVLQICGAVGLVGYLSFKNGHKAVNELAKQLMNRTSSTVKQHLDSYLAIPHQVIQMNADAVRLGLLKVRDRQVIGHYFWHQMQVYDLTYIGIGLATGEGAGAGRYDGKTVTIDDWSAKPPKNWLTYATDYQGNRTEVIETLDWDNFKEPWYIEPVKAGKPIWSPIITINYNPPYIAASAARPIYDAQNRLLGMVNADIHLLKLSDFLQQLDISRYGQVFILERNGLLIANSGTQKPFTLVKKEIQRLKALDSPNPIVQGIAKQLEQHFGNLQNVTAGTELHFDLQGKPYFVYISPWRDRYGLDWLLVVGIPEQAFMAQINANTRITIWLCLGALSVALIMAIVTAHWIGYPIRRLNQVSQALASGQLNQTVEHSNIEEFNKLANSFNRMAGQLHESFFALEKSKEELEERVEQRTQELRNALNELQRTQTQIVQAEKMSSLGQLVAGIAHEINNPVNFIYGNLTYADTYTEQLVNLLLLYQEHYPNPVSEIQEEIEAIELEFLLEDLSKLLASMKVGAKRIQEIVASLRNFSRMDEAEMKEVNIHEGIDSTLMILQNRLKAKSERPGIEVIKDYGILPQVECYAGQLNQVFMNVLSNAIDAIEEQQNYLLEQQDNPEPGRIKIRTEVRDKERISIQIKDNGVGIPESLQNRLFDPFFTTKPIGKGTGLGLSISYQIITQKHGGTFNYISQPRQGTEFIIEIPLKQSR